MLHRGDWDTSETGASSHLRKLHDVQHHLEAVENIKNISSSSIRFRVGLTHQQMSSSSHVRAGATAAGALEGLWIWQKLRERG